MCKNYFGIFVLVRSILRHFLSSVGIQTSPPIGPKRHPCNLNVCFNGTEAEDLLFPVSSKIAASTGSACSSGTTKVSHVLNAMGVDDARAYGSVRLSVGQHVLAKDVRYAAQRLSEVHREVLSPE